MGPHDVAGRVHRGPNDAMDWVFGYVPLDSPATRAMLEEVIRSTGIGAERSAKLQRGKEARAAA